MHSKIWNLTKKYSEIELKKTVGETSQTKEIEKHTLISNFETVDVIKNQLVTVLIGPTLEDVKRQINKAVSHSSLFEWRIDQLTISPEEIASLLDEREALFTFGKRVDLLDVFLPLKPNWIDLDYQTSLAIFEKVQQICPQANLIVSYHNNKETPGDLKVVLEKMKNRYASYYKIVTYAQSSLDALRVLDFLSHRPFEKLIAFCMGEKGQFSRILAPIYGSALTYLAPDPTSISAKGQLDGETFCTVYRGQELGKKTRVFGLIGEPLDKSPSHITHNEIFSFLKLNAVYVKIVIAREEVLKFLSLAKILGFLGLSVTAPLKEEVFSFVEINQETGGSINTLLFKEKKIEGLNTDGEAALDALETREKVFGKSICVIGAGGTAKALIVEALKRGAHVLCVNRTHEKARKVSLELGCKWGKEPPQTELDIVINATATSCLMFPLAKQALDVNHNSKNGPFLQNALKKGVEVIEGNELFIRQAAKQFAFWLEVSPLQIENKIREILYAKNCS